MENEIIESAYPARGNVLIVMGAEGRERALASARAVGFDGRWHDEATYKKSLETRREFHWKFFTKYSRDLKSLDLTVSDDVRLLNEFCGEMGFGVEGYACAISNQGHLRCLSAQEHPCRMGS